MHAGRMVAIKVRHPGVGAAIARDFALMMWAAKLTSWVPSLAALRLEDTLEQFSAPLREQVRLCKCVQSQLQCLLACSVMHGESVPCPADAVKVPSQEKRKQEQRQKRPSRDVLCLICGNSTCPQ